MGHLKKFPSKKKKRRIPACLAAFNDKLKTKKALQDESTSQDVIKSNKKVRTKEFELSGRRIVNVVDFFDQIKMLDKHSPIDCKFSDMSVLSEVRQGLRSGFTFECTMCKFKTVIWTETLHDKQMDVNTASVCGTVTTGGGYAQLEEFLSILDVPPISNKTFRKIEEKLSHGWAATAAAEMEQAAAEEARLARENNELDSDGVPLITVVADGAWCKRSYRTNYSSLSGVAAIVGYRTRKVLFIGVKNKYCTTCARAQSKGEPANQHTCYKNWGINQSSTSMEAALICEGFQKSEEMYNVRYAKLIGDGDSSVYKKLLECRPYKSLTVQKVECKNHLLRNMCTRLKTIATSKTAKPSVCLRKKIGSNLLRCRTAISKATEHRKKENVSTEARVENLRQDILNIPSHVFGEHKNCAERGYFCQLDTSSAPPNLNIVPSLVSVGLYSLVTGVFRDISRHSRSLLADVTSNYVEHYNSIVAKFIGGKRVNFATSGSYQGRCSAAVVQHNSGLAHYKLHKQLYDSSPGTFAKTTAMKRKRKAESQRSTKKSRKSLFGGGAEEQDYGTAAQRPDIEDETMEKEKREFLKSLQRSDEEIRKIERETVDQSDCNEWLQIRRNILTASNFGRVCKMRATTGCESMVKQLLYTSFDCEAMEYGRINEEVARNDLANHIGKDIKKCGLFIDRDHPYLGASPDGLVEDNATVEIKCPSSAKDMTPDEAIQKRKCTFWTVSKDGTIGEISKKHNFYYQVQGQLQVTKRETCIFTLWTPKGIKCVQIKRDNQFWLMEMFSKLKRFYMECVLPEIIDPRLSRSMPIRNPPYILEAQEKSKKKNGND